MQNYSRKSSHHNFSILQHINPPLTKSFSTVYITVFISIVVPVPDAALLFIHTIIAGGGGGDGGGGGWLCVLLKRAKFK
jgi:hypothetical protein